MAGKLDKKVLDTNGGKEMGSRQGVTKDNILGWEAHPLNSKESKQLGMEKSEYHQILKKLYGLEDNQDSFDCLFCGKKDHLLTECPDFLSERMCYVCGSEDHAAYACGEARKLLKKLPFCPQCKAIGHLITQCHTDNKMSIRIELLVPRPKRTIQDGDASNH